MSVNQALAVGVGTLPGHAGVPATSSMRLDAVAEVASAGLGEVTEAPPARGDDVAELGSACGGDVAVVAAADPGDVSKAAIVGGGDVAEAAPVVFGNVAKVSDGGDDTESRFENRNEDEAEEEEKRVEGDIDNKFPSVCEKSCQMEVDKIEDSDDNDDQMAERLDEDPNVESDEEEAGPSVEQPLVVVEQAVCERDEAPLTCGGDDAEIAAAGGDREVVEAALVGSGDVAEAATVMSPSVNGYESMEKEEEMRVEGAVGEEHEKDGDGDTDKFSTDSVGGVVSMSCQLEVDKVDDSFDDNDVQMVERLDEDPYVEANEEEAGVGGEQLPVVVHVQQAVCGGDSPPLSDYEKLRERNIRERDEAMKEALEELEEAKQEMRDNAPGAKKRAAEESGGDVKRKKVETLVEVRRSGRDRKPVSYVVEEETEGRSRKWRKEGRGSRTTSDSPVRRRERRKANSKQDHPPVPAPSIRNLRPRQPVNYAEDPEPEADGYIWCTPCGRVEYNGCERHPPFFGDTKEFNLVVGPSGVEGQDVGDGVFNRGETIPEGVLFGPYSGNFIPISTYKEIEKAKQESGNAWEVRDKDNKLTVGYMDPGVNPDPQQHWMSKINCPSKAGEQNLVGFQLAGQIYYRVIKNVATNTELLVWYGSTYAMNLGIKVEKIDKYKGKENHVEDAANCKFCKTGLDTEEKLEDHMGKGDNGSYKCGVKQAMEMVRMAESGERKYVCKVCAKGFKTEVHLTTHSTVHSMVKLFQCDVDGCNKSYKQRANMLTHKRIVHEGVKYECDECGRRFGQKSNMMTHYKNVHLEQKHFKCAKCGVQFSENGTLIRHMKTVHEKVRAFKCEHCGKSFGQAGSRKMHIESVHFNIRYPCTWPDCAHQAHSKTQLKYHRRRAHTQEWSLECQLCEDQLDIWWGCIFPGEMDKHRAKKHPVEWEEEQEVYKRDNPFVCKFRKCLNRFGSKVEKDRHEKKMH